MKKILTLLLSVGIFSASFAQSNHQRNNMTGTISMPLRPTDAIIISRIAGMITTGIIPMQISSPWKFKKSTRITISR